MWTYANPHHCPNLPLRCLKKGLILHVQGLLCVQILTCIQAYQIKCKQDCSIFGPHHISIFLEHSTYLLWFSVLCQACSNIMCTHFIHPNTHRTELLDTEGISCMRPNRDIHTELHSVAGVEYNPHLSRDHLAPEPQRGRLLPGYESTPWEEEASSTAVRQIAVCAK